MVNGASSGLWANGVSKASGNAGTKVMDGLTVGTASGGTLPWKGYVGQRLIYTSNLSDADKNQVGQYLADYYGLTWTDINP